MFATLQRYQDRKIEDESDSGFTLIELLIVIVVLGILAAVTVFALNGVSGTSDQAACNSDASSVNTALAAFAASNPNAIAAPASSDLTAATNGGPYLQSFPNSGKYTIAITGTAPGPYGLTVLGKKTGDTAQTWTPGSQACSSTYIN